MTDAVNVREVVLSVLMEITEEEGLSHLVLRRVLEKSQYLDKRDRAFITRTVEGTLQDMLLLDYIIERFSRVPVYNMKPLIRNLMRMSVYQLRFMDSVPDSAVCNEAVKIAQRHGFYNLKGFVNGVLRNIARGQDQIEWPDKNEDPCRYLSVMYSMPQWIVERWIAQFGQETTETVLKRFHEPAPTVVRVMTEKVSVQTVIDDLRAEGIQVERHPYLDYALEISGYNYLQAVGAFKKGWIQVQDISSMMVAEVAAPNWGDACIDVCAAPGGKALHLAEKLRGSGSVQARDISETKVARMKEAIERSGLANIEAMVRDAVIYDESAAGTADIVLADVPCSGLGVIGRKQDIKYKMTPARQTELIRLQRQILHTVHGYVKPGGTLIYSTCTIGADENQMNIKWFLENYPFVLESIDGYLCPELRDRTTKGGFLQFLPGVHRSDGFFLARLRRRG